MLLASLHPCRPRAAGLLVAGALALLPLSARRAAAFDLVPDYKTPGCMAYSYNGRYAVLPNNTFVGPDTRCNPEAKFVETTKPISDDTLRVTGTHKEYCDYTVDREIGELAYLRRVGCSKK